jgi:hypothetical protein
MPKGALCIAIYKTPEDLVGVSDRGRKRVDLVRGWVGGRIQRNMKKQWDARSKLREKPSTRGSESPPSNHNLSPSLSPACAEALPEWMELADGGSVSCAPSRLGKLVLRVTGHPRLTQRQKADQSRGREFRHLYLGFQHSWDRDLWRRWLKQVRRP